MRTIRTAVATIAIAASALILLPTGSALATQSATGPTATATLANSGDVSDAEAAANGSGDFDCGTFRCSYVFSRAVTNDIATGGALTAACAAVPTPGNIACGIAAASMVATANVAKNRNKCAKITWTKTPPPAWTWYPSVDGGSRCR